MLPLDPSSDEAVSDTATISPKEELHLYAEQMLRTAKYFKIDAHSSNPKHKSKILNALYYSVLASVAFLLLEDFLDIPTSVWEKLVSLWPVLQKADHMFTFCQEDCAFLFTHSSPSLLVWDEVQTRSRLG